MRTSAALDGQISSMAVELSALGRPVLLRFGYEFDNHACHRCEPAAYAQAFRRFATLFRSVAVMFQVGMCNPMDATACVDGFYAYPEDADEAGKVTVGSTWQELTVSLAGKDYSGSVHGAF